MLAWLMVHPNDRQDDDMASLKQIADQPLADGMTSALLVHLSLWASVFRRYCHASVC